MSAYEHLFTVFTATYNLDTAQGRVLWSFALPAGWLLHQRDVRRNAALLRAVDG